MQDIHSVLPNLSWGNSDEVRNQAIAKLQSIEEQDLPLLLQPLGKDCWESAAEAISQLGYPRVKVILPGLLEWLQDYNWPGAHRIAEFLKPIGYPLVPYIKAVFKEYSWDEDWHYFLLFQLIDKWETGIIEQLTDELLELSNGNTNDLKAMSILYEHRIIDLKEVRRRLTIKRTETTALIEGLDKKNSGVDCTELDRGFKEVLFVPELSRKYYEDNIQLFSYCNHKSRLLEYLSEIEEVEEEMSGST